MNYADFVRLAKGMVHLAKEGEATMRYFCQSLTYPDENVQHT